MIKPIPTINHKAGKRSTVYYDDYKQLEKYCDQLEKDNGKLKSEVVEIHLKPIMSAEMATNLQAEWDGFFKNFPN